MAGLNPPKGMDGIDLSPLFQSQDLPERPFANGGYFNHFYLRSDEWAYVADNRGTARELYDLTLDPGELNNVAHDQRDTQQELHARARELMGGLPPYYQGDAVAPIKR